MLSDPQRMAAYSKALKQHVTADSVVLDLGCGSGYFAVLASKLGARRVYAVEPNDIIELARQLARDNGCEKRIEFFQGASQQFTPGEPASLIISDLRGKLPLYRTHIPTIADARNRLLAAEGILLPQRDTLQAALARAPELHSRTAEPWLAGGGDPGLNFEALAAVTRNTWRHEEIRSELLASKPSKWLEIDYRSITDPDAAATVELAASEPGPVHGFFLWLEAEIAPGIGFSCGPGAANPVYGSAFFPWPEPVEMNKGETAVVSLQAQLAGENYIWSWKAAFPDAGGKRPQFQQTTLRSSFALPSARQKRAGSFTPQLNREGKAVSFALSLMAEQLPLDEIAERSHKHFPDLFDSRAAALGFVGGVSQRYSE